MKVKKRLMMSWMACRSLPLSQILLTDPRADDKGLFNLVCGTPRDAHSGTIAGQDLKKHLTQQHTRIPLEND
jgi:hypothetical protein